MLVLIYRHQGMIEFISILEKEREEREKREKREKRERKERKREKRKEREERKIGRGRSGAGGRKIYKQRFQNLGYIGYNHAELFMITLERSAYRRI